ncbi:unnamed protein product [Trichobilharzia szidati]|nr:unnamed protein product [Trichobilharzia szidati]
MNLKLFPIKILLYWITLFLKGVHLSDTKVPMVVNHNNQIRLQVGDKLRLECPIHITSSGGLVSSNENSNSNQPEYNSGVMYNWKVRDLHDYSLDTNSHYRFSQQRRILEVTEPLQVSDSGNYTCLGVTGFGKREVTFEVHVRDPNINLLCAVPNVENTKAKEPPSATPKIIGPVQNYTFKNDDSATVIARIKCACDEPVIQWLKRVEPGEEMMYEQSGATKIPLPNARITEQNEVYVILGSWIDSPAIVEKTTAYTDRSKSIHDMDTSSSSSSSDILPSENNDGKRPMYYHSKQNYAKQNHLGSEKKEQLFVTKLRFQKPLEKERHEGKYIVMTMSLSDVKSLEYIVIYVNVVQESAFLKGRRVLIYFLVPFSILLAVLGLIAYMFVFRRKRAPDHLISSSNERCILRTAELTPEAYHVIPNGKKSSSLHASSRQSSNSQNTGKPNYSFMGVQSVYPSNDNQYNQTQTGSELNNPYPNIQVNPSHFNQAVNFSQNTSMTSDPRLLLNISDDSSRVNSKASSGPIMNGNCMPNSSHPSHCLLPCPPNPHSITPPSNQSDIQQTMNNFNQFPAYFIGSSEKNLNPQVFNDSSIQPTYQPAPFPGIMLNVPQPPSNVSDVSFDQYSAVSQSPVSSSTLTNHYTAPFGDFVHNENSDCKDFRHHFQPHYLRT